MRETVPSTVDEHGSEVHPAYGMIRVARIHGGDAVLFDSDIRHDHSVVLSVRRASRSRDLHRDWIHASHKLVDELVEVQMSEAQWASLVSSFNTEGVACTIRSTMQEHTVPGLEFESRVGLSATETRNAAKRALASVEEAFAAVEEKPTKANLRTLKFAIANLPSNLKFAADSLTEHTENVVQKARVDIEAMVHSAARAVGIDPVAVLTGSPFGERPAELEAAQEHHSNCTLASEHAGPCCTCGSGSATCKRGCPRRKDDA